jgi:hypothetical protein
LIAAPQGIYPETFPSGVIGPAVSVTGPISCKPPTRAFNAAVLAAAWVELAVSGIEYIVTVLPTSSVAVVVVIPVVPPVIATIAPAGLKAKVAIEIPTANEARKVFIIFSTSVFYKNFIGDEIFHCR